MDLRLATLKAVSFYLLHNVSTLNQCKIYPVAQLCVNTLPATKITLITDVIYLGRLRVNLITVAFLLGTVNQFTAWNKDNIKNVKNYLHEFHDKKEKRDTE
jgi:hypothetical protein